MSETETPAKAPVPATEGTDEEKIEVEKEVIEPVPDEETLVKEELKEQVDLSSWTPRTALGAKVKGRQLTDIDAILDAGMPILEAEIVDALLPGLQSDLLMIGQSRGKFGGGQRRIFKQTQKKTMEGNKPSFSCYAIVGNGDGYLGGGMGKSKDTVPAREKAVRTAKRNIFKIRRGCGSWECGCKTPHSIPFKVTGKCGSVRIELMPAPKGKGLVVEKECAKILRLAGIKDVWSVTRGQTGQKHNLVTACLNALKQLMQVKMRHDAIAQLGAISGKITAEAKQ